MAKKMLIDAAQTEEVRVAIVQGNRVEDFEFESSLRKQLKGNIYLAKVTRIEPSLQAAFVDYGGNRHGFLPLSEIHPDYYQIPVEDREALLADEAREAAEAQAAEDAEDEEIDAKPKRGRRPKRAAKANSADEATEPTADQASDNAGDEGSQADDEEAADATGEAQAKSVEPETGPAEGDVEVAVPVELAAEGEEAEPESEDETESAPEGKTQAADTKDEVIAGPAEDEAPTVEAESAKTDADEAASTESETRTVIVTDEPPKAATEDADADAAEVTDKADVEEEGEAQRKPRGRRRGGRGRRQNKKTDADSQETPANEEAEQADGEASEAEAVETTGGEGDEDEAFVARRRARRRHYRIQEVIRPRQILLVQVVKEERGTKGAALTTYLSLAGRYGVLMPNTARGGGISRKISNREDRKRLKGIVRDLEVSKGMGLIVRTAGAQRTRQEIKRDYDYLIRLWDQIRELTLKSVAPCLIYEEGSLLLRAIRDFYSKDVESVLVQGEDGYKEAKGYMKLLMPSHAKNVQRYKDDVPLFQRYQVDSQLEQMIEPEVQLKSGGYLVINPTEALVSIDINSGRSTREKNIEQTALRTNLEAAEEIARQLRLRDLAGLVVIDFIDMDENRNNKAVERKMKDCLKNDRARIQVGRISQFGLLEMSRQRLGSSLLETAAKTCPHCAGSGLLRTDDSAALSALRRIEEEALRGKASEIAVHLHPDVALYLLNHKRDQIGVIEQRHAMRIVIAANNDKRIGECVIERLKAQSGDRAQRPTNEAVASPAAMEMDDEAPQVEQEAEVAAPEKKANSGDEDGEPKKRRRGRRGGRRRNRQNQDNADNATELTDGEAKAQQSDEAQASDKADDTPKAELAEKLGADDAKPDADDAKPDADDAKPDVKEIEITEKTSSNVDEAEVEIAQSTQADAVAEAAAEPAPPAEEKPAGPARKGWWQRRFGN
ncbi:MAG: Rne/Rng family ribonuclease [Alphaproteobacteria bacterium]